MALVVDQPRVEAEDSSLPITLVVEGHRGGMKRELTLRLDND